MGVSLGPGYSQGLHGTGQVNAGGVDTNLTNNTNASTLSQSTQAGLGLFGSYNAASNLPKLQPPGTTSPLVINATNGQAYNLTPKGNTESQEQKQNEYFTTQLTGLLNDLSQQGVSQDDIALAKYAYYHPDDPSVPDSVKQLLNQAVKQAQDSTQTNFNLDEFQLPPPDTQLFDASVGTALQEGFNDQLKQFAADNHLSSEDVAKIIYASTHPDDPSVDPKSKEIASQLKGAALSELKEEIALPSSFKQPAADTAGADANIQSDFSSNFLTLLDEFQPPLSEEQKNVLTYSFNNPDSPPPAGGDPDLAAVLSQLQGQAADQTKKEDGLPDTYTLKADSQSYNLMLNGAFTDSLRKMIKSPPEGLVDDAFNQLTPEELHTVFSLAVGNADMDSPNIPDNLKAYAKALRKAAQADVEKKYSIPEGKFQPQNGDMPNAELDQDPGLQFASQAVQISDDLLKGFQEIVNRYPDGADKTVYANYLNAVNAALNRIRDLLYELQGSDSDLNVSLSDSNLQSSQNRIAIGNASNEKSLKDIRDRPKPKGGPIGALMKFFAKFGPIFSVIIASVFLGPAGTALMLLDMKFHIISKVSKAVAHAVGKMVEAMGGSPKFVKAIEMVAQIAFIAVMFLSMGPAAGSMFMFLGPQIVQSSGVLETVATTFCNNPEKAKEIAMYLGIALGATVAVAMMCVPFPGAQIQAVTAGLTSALTNIATSIIRAIPVIGNAILKVAREAVEFLQALPSLLAFAGRTAARAFTDWIGEILPGTINVINKTPSALSNAADAAFSTVGNYVDNALSFSGIAEHIQLAGNIEQGIYNLKLADYLKKLAKSKESQATDDAMIEKLQELAKNLRKLMDQILANMSGTSDLINDINNNQNLLYKNASDSQSALFNVQG